MGSYGKDIHVSTTREPLPDLSDNGVRVLMEEALKAAEQNRVNAVTRKNLLMSLWLERERRAHRDYDDEEGFRAADAYANGEGSRDTVWRTCVADNKWHMERAGFYANILIARKAFLDLRR